MRHARFCGPRTHGGKPYDGAGKVKIFKIKQYNNHSLNLRNS